MLPRAVQLDGEGTGFRLVDWDIWSLATPPAVGGVMSIATDPTEQGFVLLVERMVVGTTSTTATVCNWYAGPAGALTPPYRRDGTPAGNDAVAEYPRPVLVPPGIPLTVVWTGASAGAVGFATIQWQLYQRVA